MENGLSIIEKIVAILMILGGVIGTLVTAISTAHRAKLEVDAKIKKDKEELAARIKKEDAELRSDLEAEEVAIEIRRVELAEQMRLFYDRIIKEMDAKYCSSQEEISGLKQSIITIKIEMEKQTQDLEALRKELRKVKSEKETLREAGILLIRAIEESMLINGAQSNGVLKTLNEVRALFENGNPRS